MCEPACTQLGPPAIETRAQHQDKKDLRSPHLRPSYSMGPGDQSDVGFSLPLPQKLLPQTDGRPGDPQSHLSPLRRLERIIAEERLLLAL